MISSTYGSSNDDGEGGNDLSTSTFVHNEEFAARLRTVIARVGGPAKAGDIAGVTGEQIGKWRDGKAKPSFFGLANICTAAGASLDWLLTGEDRPSASQIMVQASSSPDAVQIPRWNVRASAGAGALALAEEVSSHFAVDRDWLMRNLPAWAGPNAIVGILEGHGDSMEPTIRDGDLIIAVKDPPEYVIDKGGVFVVLHHGHLRLKRIHMDMRSGDITLISDNPRYPAETVPRDRQEFDLQIVAQIFFSGGRLRS